MVLKRDAADILKDALAPPTDGRAALAGSLLESLDIEVDEDAEAAWATKVNRRVDELDSGAVNAIPWAEVPGCSRLDVGQPPQCSLTNRRVAEVAITSKKSKGAVPNARNTRTWPYASRYATARLSRPGGS